MKKWFNVFVFIILGHVSVVFCQQRKSSIKVLMGAYSANFVVPRETFINDSTYSYLTVLDDPDIVVGADFQFEFYRSTRIYGQLNLLSFSPTAAIRMGQTLNTASGPKVVYDSWGTSYSFLRTNITCGLAQPITRVFSINAGIGIGINTTIKEPFIGNNPGKFLEIANALRPIYKGTNSMFQLGLCFDWRKFSVNGNYQKTLGHETRSFRVSGQSYRHLSRLQYWSLQLGYKVR